MTNEELDAMKYKVCCPMCDNYKCVRGTEKCEAELWKRRRMKQMTEEDKLYADKLRNKALSDYERLDHAINELERQTCETSRNNLETTSQDCISRQEAIRVAEQGQIQGYEWQFKELCNLPPVTPKAEGEE